MNLTEINKDLAKELKSPKKKWYKCKKCNRLFDGKEAGGFGSIAKSLCGCCE